MARATLGGRRTRRNVLQQEAATAPIPPLLTPPIQPRYPTRSPLLRRAPRRAMIRVGRFAHRAPRHPRPARVATRSPILALPAESLREPRRLPIPIRHRGSSLSIKHGKIAPLIVSPRRYSFQTRAVRSRISVKLRILCRLDARVSRRVVYCVRSWVGVGIKICPALPRRRKVEVRTELHYDVTCAPPDRILIGGGAGQLRRAPVGRYTCACIGPLDVAPPMAGAARCLRGAAYAVSSAFGGPICVRSLASLTQSQREVSWQKMSCLNKLSLTHSVAEVYVMTENIVCIQFYHSGKCHVCTSLPSTPSYTQCITTPQQHPHTSHKAHPPPAQDTSSTSRTCAP